MTFKHDASFAAIQNHAQWSTVKEVCGRLKKEGYRALLAGGSVRDLLMQREPHDFDIATDASPDQVEELFPKSVAVGKAFGVMVLPFEGFQIEVATFREDLDYRDGRRPEGVRFSTPEQDARRRDFTVNALFLDPETGEVFDFVGGEADIHGKILRTVGDPEQRFGEDKLRLLRAVRFVAQLGFAIEPATLTAVTRQASSIEQVSRERVRDELLKLLACAGRVSGLRLLSSTGLLRGAFRHFARAIESETEVWLARFENGEPAFESGKAAQVYRICLFLWPVKNRATEKELHEGLKELRLDQKLSQAILFCLNHVGDLLNPTSIRPGKLALILAERSGDFATGAVLVSLVECLVSSGDFGKTIDEAARRAQLAEVVRLLGPNFEKPRAFLTGEDLKKQGFPPGPTVGKILREALLMQIEGALPTRDKALRWLDEQTPRS